MSSLQRKVVTDMNKLKSVIQYECVIAFRYIWIFYAIQYAIVLLICSIGGGVSGVEINTMIFVGILGVLSFKEDFKMLIQNGFTRKYIFLGAISLFTFICGIMSLIDTIVGNAMHSILGKYYTLFGSIYGYENIFANWAWLFLAYMFVCSVMYLAVLVSNKIGKKPFLYLGIVLSGGVLLIVAVFRFVLTDKSIQHIESFLLKTMGFMSDGTMNLFMPLLTFILLLSIFLIVSYAIIRRSELK